MFHIAFHVETGQNEENLKDFEVRSFESRIENSNNRYSAVNSIMRIYGNLND